MAQLPSAFEKHDQGILTDKGEISVNKVMHKWSHISKRVPNYFDLLLSMKSAKDYSNAVFNMLLELQPSEKNEKAKQNLKLFLKSVDTVSFPVIAI